MNELHASRESADTVRVLVVNRWNSWVQVWFPDTDEREWVNLAEQQFEPDGGEPTR